MGRYQQKAAHICRGCLSVVLLVPLLRLPPRAEAQLPQSSDSLSAIAAPQFGPLYPELRRTRDLTLSGVGGSLLATGFLMSVDVREVPLAGFDPREISWAVDRDAVGDPRPSAGTASDRARDAALLLPIVLGLANASPGQRWSGLGRRGVVYLETMAIAQGLTRIGKVAFGRPRPYAYLPEEVRLKPPGYDATDEETFHAMPSGHSSSAWTGVAIAVTEHLLHRPDARWLERVGVGLLGGTLAGATSALRVAAGQHHPTDVVAGAGIGIVTGVVVPLLHRGGQPVPSLHSWMETAGGTLLGVAAGVLVAGAY